MSAIKKLTAFLFLPLFLIFWSSHLWGMQDVKPAPQKVPQLTTKPLLFVGNQGQFAPDVQYSARGNGYQVFLSETEVSFAARGAGGQAHAVMMQFPGSAERFVLETGDATGATMNYFRGQDRSQWVHEAKTYRQVRISELYEGIDLLFYGNGSQLQYDFILQPGADPRKIRIHLQGADRLSIDDAGHLVMDFGSATLRHQAPYIYQNIDGDQVPVAGSFRMVDEQTVAFDVDAYDASLALVIDPIIQYSSFLGGTADEVAYGLDLDAVGNIYLSGVTSSFDFPVVQGSLDPNYNGGTSEIFVTKLNSQGTAVIYSTFIGGAGTTNGSGGSGQDVAYDIAVDDQGAVFVSGATASEDFPAERRFYSLIRAEGEAVNQQVSIILIAGEDVLTVEVNEKVDPAYVPFDISDGGSYNADTSTITWTLSSATAILGYKISIEAEDPIGTFTVNGGPTFDIDVGDTPPYASRSAFGLPTLEVSLEVEAVSGFGSDTRSEDGVVFKLNPAGNQLEYSILLGTGSPWGVMYDFLYGIEVDSQGRAHVVGTTYHIEPDSDAFAITCFPTTEIAFERIPILAWTGFEDAGKNNQDATYTVINPDGESLHYSTLIGGSLNEALFQLVINENLSEAIAVGGSTSNPIDVEIPYPVTFGTAFDPSWNTAEDAVISHFSYESAGFSSLAYSTYLGSGTRGAPGGGDNPGGVGDDGRLPNPAGQAFPSDDTAFDVDIDADGNVTVVGMTNGSDFPTSDLGFQRRYAGETANLDGFVFRYNRFLPQNVQMIYSSYLGGSQDDWASGVKVNADGEAVITGVTNSTDFPVTSDAFDIDHNSGRDVFLTVMNPEGTGINYSSFLGGFSDDEANNIDLLAGDQSKVYLTGYTLSNNFPTTETAYQPDFAGIGDAFLTIYDLSIPTPVRNDNFQERRFLGGLQANVSGNNIPATKEANEPNHAGNAGGKSVWFSWSSAAYGRITMSTEGSDFDTLLAVYRGPDLINLIPVAANDNVNQTDRYSEVTFDVEPGDIFSIAIDGRNGASGNYRLNLDFFNPNDDFDYALEPANEVTGLSAVLDFSNVAATNEALEPNHGSVSAGHSVWTTWRAPVTGRVTFTPSGTALETGAGFTPVMAVYQTDDFQQLEPTRKGDNVISAETVDASTGEIIIIYTENGEVSFEAERGVAYRVVMDSPISLIGLDYRGNMRLNIKQDYNDAIGEAVRLVGSTTPGIGAFNHNVLGDNRLATQISGEPQHAGNAGGKSLWWSYTAPDTGILEVSTLGSNFDTLLAVYNQNENSGVLAELASNDNIAAGQLASQLQLEVTGGSTYWIAVDGSFNPATGTTAEGDIYLGLRLMPSNDLFASSRIISGTTLRDTSFNYNATREAAELNLPASFNDKTVWWSWTSPSAGRVFIDTAGSDFDTILSVFTGTNLNNLSLVATNDNFGAADGTSQVEFNSLDEETYFIQVAGNKVTNQQGSVVLNLETFSNNAGDNLADAGSLNGYEDNAESFNGTATRENAEPRHAGVATGRSQWWLWEAPRSGMATLQATSEEFTPVVAAYSGTMIGSLTELPRIETGITPGIGIHQFEAQQGVVYALVVASLSENGEVGTGTFQVNLSLTAGNNNFADAFELPATSENITANGYNINATLQAGEPAHGAGFGGGKSVWYRWTAPNKGLIEFDTLGSGFNTVFSVYRGSSLNTLVEVVSGQPIEGNQLASEASFLAFPGRTYYIAVDGREGAEGQFVLNAHFTPSARTNLVNVSTRGLVGDEDHEALIAGFVVGGTPGEKSTVLIRTLGRTMVFDNGLAVEQVITNPELEIYREGTKMMDVSKWVDDPASAALLASNNLAPKDPNEAAIALELEPGLYSAVVKDAAGGNRLGIVEVYVIEDENSTGLDNRVINLSTRGLVGTGDNVLIGGFAITGANPKTVAIRGIGQGLAALGIPNALGNANLSLFQGSEQIATNNDWASAENSGDLQNLGLAPSEASDAALLVTLNPGNYTVHLSGQGSSGIGLFEIYEVD